MNAAPTRCQCPHWQKLFVPDYRHRGRQNYGSAPACQAASKRRTQARWLGQPESPPGALPLTRQQDWLELDLPAPALSLYESEAGGVP